MKKVLFKWITIAGMMTILVSCAHHQNIDEPIPPKKEVKIVHKNYGLPKITRKIEYIAIHHTAGYEKSVQQIRNEHLQRGFRDIAYSYVVFPDGRVETGRDVNKRDASIYGAHDGVVSIVLVGALHKKAMPHRQFMVATQLAAKLAIVTECPYWRVRGHSELALPHHGTLCPSTNLKQFRVQVRKEIEVLK